MGRRQVVGLALAAAVIIGNVLVWYARQGPVERIPDTRGVIRSQAASEFRSAVVVPIEGVTATFRQTLTESGKLEIGRNAAGFGEAYSFKTLSDASRNDLINTLGGAVAALATGKADALIDYMTDRGMKLDRRSLGEASAEFGLPPTGSPEKQAFAVWDRVGIEPRWSHWAPGETTIHVWKPRSLRHVSMIQLGRNASWVWGNETVFRSFFTTSPSFEQASRREPTPVADARVLIEHDASLDQERSPYFFRFWYSEKVAAWRPLALKLVRAADDPLTNPPQLLF